MTTTDTDRAKAAELACWGEQWKAPQANIDAIAAALAEARAPYDRLTADLRKLAVSMQAETLNFKYRTAHERAAYRIAVARLRAVVAAEEAKA